MTTFRVTAWWTTLRADYLEFDAATAEEAIKLAEKACEEGDWTLEHNRAVDDSDGPTYLSVYDDSGDTLATTEPSNPAADPLTQQAVAFIEKMATLEIESDYFADGDAVADLCALVHEARAITGKQPSPPQSDAETRMYRVKWEIDVEAATPREAAQQAREMQRDTNAIVGVFDVETKDDAWLIDLDRSPALVEPPYDDCEPRIEPDGAGD